MDGFIDRARNALERHADFADDPPVIERKRVSRLFPSHKATPDERAEYQYELTERAGRYMDAGMTEQEADRLALDDLGCVEFWDYLQSTGGLYGPDKDEIAEMERAA